MDSIDAAQEREQRDRDLALQAQAERTRRIAQSHQPRDPKLRGLCMDCDEPIAPERIAAIGVGVRCTECATDWERRMAQFRGGR